MLQRTTPLHVLLGSVLALASCGDGGDGATADPVTTEVGSTLGPAVTGEIGPSGGTLVSADGLLELEVPAGALASDTTLSITPISNHAPGGLGTAYRLEPDGLTFDAPVVLAFSFAEADLRGGEPTLLGGAFQTSEGYWEWLPNPTVDSVGERVEVTTTHFTDFVMVEGARLWPGQADVRVGETVQLEVAVCYVPSIDPDDLMPLALDCDSSSRGRAPGVTVRDWAVNGVPGGSSATGTLSSSGLRATYTAPRTVPTANPVAVSARIGTTLVVSNIDVKDDAPVYVGTVEWSNPDIGHTGGTASVTFRRATDYDSTNGFIGTGTISATVTIDEDCAPRLVEAPLDSAATNDDWHLHSYLEVRNERDDIYPETFEFSLIGEPVPTTFTCDDGVSPPYTLDADVILLTMATYCPSVGYPSYTDPNTLSGTYGCAGTPILTTFSFTSQD